MDRHHSVHQWLEPRRGRGEASQVLNIEMGFSNGHRSPCHCHGGACCGCAGYGLFAFDFPILFIGCGMWFWKALNGFGITRTRDNEEGHLRVHLSSIDLQRDVVLEDMQFRSSRAIWSWSFVFRVDGEPCFDVPGDRYDEHEERAFQPSGCSMRTRLP